MTENDLDLENLSMGACPEDWHERNDTGFIPGGAGALAERILSEPRVVSQDGGDGWNLARDTADKDSSNDGHAWQGMDRSEG
jgi:hypothetical protein